jgi:hypothetical protein
LELETPWLTGMATTNQTVHLGATESLMDRRVTHAICWFVDLDRTTNALIYNAFC